MYKIRYIPVHLISVNKNINKKFQSYQNKSLSMILSFSTAECCIEISVFRIIFKKNTYKMEKIYALNSFLSQREFYIFKICIFFFLQKWIYISLIFLWKNIIIRMENKVHFILKKLLKKYV